MNFVESHTCNSLLYHLDYTKTKLQSISPFIPDCEVREYILKQSEFITNHYIDARNECLRIFNESNSTCQEIEDTRVNFVCLNVKKEDKSCLILPSSDFSKSSTELIVPRKSKFVKESKLKKRLYFVTKEISLLSISFITSINMKSAFLKSKDMTVYGLLNCIVSNEEDVECNEENVTKLMKDKPKVVVERATTSTISFGSISALLDENENQKDVYFNNFSDESPLKKSPDKIIKCDVKHNDYVNNLLVSDIGNHKHRFCDDNYNLVTVKNKNYNKLLHSVNEGVYQDNENKFGFKSNRRRRGRPSMFKQNYSLFKLSKYSKRINKYFCQNSRNEVKRQPKNVCDLELVKNELLNGKGPTAAVVLHRLDNDYIHETISKADQSLCDEKIPISQEAEADPVYAAYAKPSYIVSGPGTKIKDIPKIANKIWNADQRAIRLIHHVLFLKMEKDRKSRLNILEFSGYPECQKDFLDRRLYILSKMHILDIRTISKIFSPKIAYCKKAEVIEELSRFFKSPSANFGWEWNKESKQFTCMQVPRARLRKIKKPKPTEDPYVKKLTFTNSQVCDISEPWVETYAEKTLFEKLRDIDKICFNVECAAPEDLNELNDLLFIKPCESSEIHQQILEFSGFAFSENSIEYQYRKTLMHYMDFCIIKKIALLLDIPGCEDYSNKQELSGIVLKFLMEPKQKSGGTRNKNQNRSLCVFNSSNAIIKKDQQLQVQEKILPPDVNKVASDLSTTQFPVQLETSNVSMESKTSCLPDLALPHISNKISPHHFEDSSAAKPYPVQLQNSNAFMESYDLSDLALPNVNNKTFPHHFEDISDTNHFPDHGYSRGSEKKENEVQNTHMELQKVNIKKNGEDVLCKPGLQRKYFIHKNGRSIQVHPYLVTNSVNPSLAAVSMGKLNCTPRRTNSPLIARVQAM